MSTGPPLTVTNVCKNVSKRNLNWTRLRDCKSPPRHLTWTKNDPRFESDFQINSDLDTDVCWITPKMLCIHYLVGVSHFAESLENRPVTVWEMLINLQSPILQWQEKCKNGLESLSRRTRSSQKVNEYFRLVGPIITPSFNEIRWLLLQ